MTEGWGDFVNYIQQLRLRRLAGDESGMTLMEVIVAIAIMTIIATAAASVSLNGTKTESAEERAQVAVTLANSYMEQVSGQSVALNTTTGVSNIYTGRVGTGTTGVSQAFTDNAGRPGVAQTNPVWDPHAPGDGAPAIPISTTLPPQNGTIYTVTTLIGSCYQSTTIQTAGTSSVPVYNNCVATAVGQSTAMIRVIVIVKWMAGSQCQANGCYYDASTLLDPDGDLEWVTH
jgi:prepilin-type N-terminal cleavage/methylation domain-containing protein